MLEFYGYPTVFELLNIISARLRLHDWGPLLSAPPNHPNIPLYSPNGSTSHPMTCGRFSYPIRPPVPVRTKTQDRTDSGECLHSRTSYSSF